MFSVASVCLSVCLFVCSHDNFRTIRHRMMKLGDYVNCTKLSSKFECQGQRSKVDITGDKKTKKCGIFYRVFLCGAVLSQFYSGGKISACCLVLSWDYL